MRYQELITKIEPYCDNVFDRLRPKKEYTLYFNEQLIAGILIQGTDVCFYLLTLTSHNSFAASLKDTFVGTIKVQKTVETFEGEKDKNSGLYTRDCESANA